MVACMFRIRIPSLPAGATLALALVVSGCSTLTPGEAPVVSAVPVAAGSVGVAPAVPPEVVTVAPPKPAPASVPPVDAVPRAERISSGHPNRPYAIRGELYVPENSDVPMREVGVASWYGHPFHGRLAASGERYDMNAMTAAHPTMPLPSYARVRNLANGREVIVRVNDRGPFRAGRIIDLSRAAARRLGFSGTTMVEVERLTHDDIRSGAWRAKPATRVAQKGTAARVQAAAPRSLAGQAIAAN